MVEVRESEEFLEDWVEEKLDEGVEPQRLKDILRERDRDPEVVDRVASPFEEESGDEHDEESEDTNETEESREGDGFVSNFLS